MAKFFNDLLESLPAKQPGTPEYTLARRIDEIKTLHRQETQLLHDYMNGHASLLAVCTPAMTELLFRTIPDFFVRKDEIMHSKIAAESNSRLHASYYLRDPMEPEFYANAVDIVANTEPISSAQRENVRHIVKADKIINIEFFEYPHNTNWFYFGSELAEGLKQTYSNPNLSTQQIWELNRQLPAFRDLEKLHLKFATDGNTFVPIYVGVGNQDVYFENKGQSKEQNDRRFLRYVLGSKDPFIEAGELTELPLDQLPKTREGEFHQTTIKNVHCLIEWAPQQKGDQIFKGFFKTVAPGMQFQVDATWKKTPVSATQYFAAYQSGSSESFGGWPILRNAPDLLTLVNTLTPKYEQFWEIIGHPYYRAAQQPSETWRTLKELGKHAGTKYMGKDFRLMHNAAHDLNLAAMHARFKCLALVFGNYVTSGKLDELARNTYAGCTTNAL